MSDRSRDQAFETLRTLAMFGVVAFHAKAPLSEVNYAGLVSFVVMTPFFETFYNWDRPRSLMAVAKTYLIPWAFWMCAYGAINIVIGRPILPYGPGLQGLLAGTIIHLWFLPAMFAVVVALNLLKRVASRPVVFWCSCFAAALSFTCLLRLAGGPLPPPYAQWVHAAPAVFFGVALGLAPSVRYGWSAYIVTLACLTIGAMAHQPGISITYPIGVASVVVASRVGDVLPTNYNVQSVSSCTYGIYLTHMVWVLGLGRVFGGGSYLVAVAAFAIALSTVWTARNFLPATRMLIG